MKIEELSWSTVLIVIGAIILACTIYNTIYSALKNWREARKRKNQPVDDLNTKVAENATKIKAHDQMLENDKKQLDEMGEQQRIMMRALMAILSHEINGNSTENLKKSLAEINDFLIGR